MARTRLYLLQKFVLTKYTAAPLEQNLRKAHFEIT